MHRGTTTATGAKESDHGHGRGRQEAAVRVRRKFTAVLALLGGFVLRKIGTGLGAGRAALQVAVVVRPSQGLRRLLSVRASDRLAAVSL